MLRIIGIFLLSPVTSCQWTLPTPVPGQSGSCLPPSLQPEDGLESPSVPFPEKLHVPHEQVHVGTLPNIEQVNDAAIKYVELITTEYLAQ